MYINTHQTKHCLNRFKLPKTKLTKLEKIFALLITASTMRARPLMNLIVLIVLACWPLGYNISSAETVPINSQSLKVYRPGGYFVWCQMNFERPINKPYEVTKECLNRMRRELNKAIEKRMNIEQFESTRIWIKKLLKADELEVYNCATYRDYIKDLRQKYKKFDDYFDKCTERQKRYCGEQDKESIAEAGRPYQISPEYHSAMARMTRRWPLKFDEAEATINTIIYELDHCDYDAAADDGDGGVKEGARALYEQTRAEFQKLRDACELDGSVSCDEALGILAYLKRQYHRYEKINNYYISECFERQQHRCLAGQVKKEEATKQN